MGLGLRSSTLISSTKVRWSVIVSKSGSKFNTFECFECHHANGHCSLQVMMMLIVSSSSRRNKPTEFREAYRVRSTRTCDTKQHSKNCHSDMSVRCLSGLLSQELQNTFLTPTQVSANGNTPRQPSTHFCFAKCDIRLINRSFSIPQTRQDPFQHCSLSRLWNAWPEPTHRPRWKSRMNAI